MGYKIIVNGEIEIPVGEHTDLFDEKGEVIDICEIPAKTLQEGTKVTKFELYDPSGVLMASRVLPIPIIMEDTSGLRLTWTLKRETKVDFPYEN